MKTHQAYILKNSAFVIVSVRINNAPLLLSVQRFITEGAVVSVMAWELTIQTGNRPGATATGYQVLLVM
jgi:hypothetical protein